MTARTPAEPPVTLICSGEPATAEQNLMKLIRFCGGSVSLVKVSPSEPWNDESIERAISTSRPLLTVPNTVGLFERHILEVTRRAHAAGAQCYMDGANLNALMGLVRPGDLSFDVIGGEGHLGMSTAGRIGRWVDGEPRPISQ